MIFLWNLSHLFFPILNYIIVIWIIIYLYLSNCYYLWSGQSSTLHTSTLFFIFKTIIKIWLIYNVVLISGKQKSDSALYIHTHTHTHTYIYIFQISFIYSLLQDIEYKSLCYTVGLCCLYISNVFYIYICFVCLWACFCSVDEFICITLLDSTIGDL